MNTLINEYFNHFFLADDIVLINDNLWDAQQILKELKQIAEIIGLTINFQNTKFMAKLITSKIYGKEIRQAYGI